METLARWAGYLAIAGGAMMAIITAVSAYDPSSPAWVGFFLVPTLLGGAVLGFQERTKESTGRLGWASAWLSAIGALALLVLLAYSALTSEGSAANYNVASDPLIPFWIATAAAWFVGNLGYAVALLRGRALSRPGAWLVVAGAAVAILVTAALGQNLPPAAYLVFAIFGIGWIVIGYDAVRPAPVAATT